MSLPGFAFGTLREITIHHYNITVIQSCSLSPFTFTEMIILNSNEITHISKCLFPELHTMDLSCNRLTNISEFMTSVMPKLQMLNLSWNEIEFLQGEYFSDMTLLAQIDISHNRLMQFLPDSFHGYLDQERDQASIRYLFKLKSLDLSNNLLPHISAILFTETKFLSMLNLGSNRITHVEQMSFYYLIELVTLDLSCNLLKTLSHGEGRWAAEGGGLVEYKVSFNCTLSIFHGLTNLRTLNVSQNKIKYLSQNTFCDLTRLNTLDIARNHIHFLSRNVFKGLNSLKCLILRKNRIQMIESSTFLPLHQVNSINLEDNCLSGLNDNLFDGNSNLTDLHLHNNDLITVPLAVSKWSQRFSWYSHWGNHAHHLLSFIVYQKFLILNFLAVPSDYRFVIGCQILNRQ